MCLKCNSCKNPLQLSIDRGNLEIHLICDMCNTSENHTLTATQIACIESLPPSERLRRVELFLTLKATRTKVLEDNYAKTTGGEVTLAQSIALDRITNPPPMKGGEAPTDKSDQVNNALVQLRALELSLEFSINKPQPPSLKDLVLVRDIILRLQLSLHT